MKLKGLGRSLSGALLSLLQCFEVITIDSSETRFLNYPGTVHHTNCCGLLFLNFSKGSASMFFIRYFKEINMELSKFCLTFPCFSNLIDLALWSDFVYHFIIRPCDLTLFNVQWDVELQYLKPILSIPFIQTR